MTVVLKNIIKASFSRCEIPNRKETFRKCSCIMPISVGQQLKVHEGAKFAATMKLVNESFKRCTLLVDDTIQRHTMKIFSDASKEILYQKALLEGDLWLARNKPIYSTLKIEYDIKRWDYWLKHEHYENQYEFISKLYQENFAYKTAIHATIDEYLLRNSHKFDRSDNRFIQKATKNCLEYLIEECAVMCLWAEEGFNFEVYPSGRSAAMQVTHELVIIPRYSNMLTSVSLRFKKYLITN